MNLHETLLLPENLYYAWRKARRLYDMADGLIDYAAIYSFELDLENELNKIHQSFERGEYKLDEIKPLPRPKKIDENDTAINRQFYDVSVRDQVAWIAVINVIGPRLDRIMPPWSYGNRLYRLAWYDEIKDGVRSKLEIGPYRHARGHLYKKFQHSWPLFRRHIALTAKSMTRTLDPDSLNAPDERSLDEGIKSKLQYLKPEYWTHNKNKNKTSDLYHASFDLKQFYPSVNIGKLYENLIECLPGLADEPELQNILGSMLSFEVDSTSVPEPLLDNAEPGFKKEGKIDGLPTGLFVSGFLANAALLPIDLKVEEELKKNKAEAHFRFVDDHAVISYNFDNLCEWIKWYENLLIEMSIGPKVHQDKYDPGSLSTYLYEKADGKDDKRKDVIKDCKKEDALKDCRIDGKNPTKLLTKTLGQVSAIAATNPDVLDDDGLEDRMKQLEWLLLADIPDREMRGDTRAAFAAGQISKTAQILVQETNDLVIESRKLACLESKRPQKQAELKEHAKKVNGLKKRVAELHKSHGTEESKKLRRCFDLLMQAFADYPGKPRLFFRIIQFCQNTGHPGLAQILERIKTEMKGKKEHLIWVDYYRALLLQIAAGNVLSSVRKMFSSDALWSERDSARKHLEDISKLKTALISVPDERAAYFHRNAMTRFGVYSIVTARFLNLKGSNSDDRRLAGRLEELGGQFADVSMDDESTAWEQKTAYPIGAWAHQIEPALSFEDELSVVWKTVEERFDCDIRHDMLAARRYPEHFMGRAFRQFTKPGPDAGNTEQLFEATLNSDYEKRTGGRPEHEALTRAASDRKKPDYLILSEWADFLRNECDAFDPRRGEWTALEIVRQIIQFIKQDNSLEMLDRTHLENILVPVAWKNLSNDKSTGLMSWEAWRHHVKNSKQIEAIVESKAVCDYRFRANPDILISGNPDDVRYYTIGRLLIGLLKPDYSGPRMWNFRENEHVKPYPIAKILSSLAVSSRTLSIIKSCTTPRAAETRAIHLQPERFGWEKGREPNDTEFDPPNLTSPDKLIRHIEAAQKELVNYQISVSMNQPLQLIPVHLDHIEETDNDK